MKDGSFGRRQNGGGDRGFAGHRGGGGGRVAGGRGAGGGDHRPQTGEPGGGGGAAGRTGAGGGVAARADTEEGAEAAVAAAIDRFGSCDILVNNAGTNPAYGPLAEVDLGALDRTWHVNLRGPLLYVRAAWARWMKEHGGVVCNNASVGGRTPAHGLGAYNVSKAGLIFMTKQLAYEMAPAVRVVGVAPGVIKTRLSELLWKSDEQAAGDNHPMRRLGELQDCGRGGGFPMFGAGLLDTGVTLDVDGGLYKRHQLPVIPI